jgi:acyl-CoA synthetase
MFEFAGRTLTESCGQQYIDQGSWTNESFADVLERSVKLHPNLLHKDEERTISYKEMWNEIESVAANLYNMGIRKGDTVAIQLPNTLDYVIAVFGAARIGAISVLLQVDLGPQAILDSLEQSKAKVWIITDNFQGRALYDRARDIQQKIPDLKHLIVQGDTSQVPSEALSFSSLRSRGNSLSEQELHENRPEPLDAFIMVFTSGTTGSPKGVVHLHGNYVWAVRAYAKNFGYQPEQAVLDLAPICHQTGMLAGIMMPILSGGRILLLERFSTTRVFKWIEQEKPTFLIGAPPHVIHIANSPKLKSVDTSSVKLFIYAGAPVPSTVLQRLQTDGGIRVGGMFGWTEGLVVTATRPEDPIEAVSSTVGSLIPGIEVRLVDDTGSDVEPGTPGEMWSRGPNFSAGYFENPEAASRQWDEDGWFHSGDILYQDENGRYKFIARADDIINRGGTKVNPKSVEDVIGGHTAVERVSVVGAPHETLGQQIVACIVLKEGCMPFSLPELRQFLDQCGLAKFQFPDRIEFMSELPTTHSGKVKNKDLRERFHLEAMK